MFKAVLTFQGSNSSSSISSTKPVTSCPVGTCWSDTVDALKYGDKWFLPTSNDIKVLHLQITYFWLRYSVALECLNGTTGILRLKISLEMKQRFTNLFTFSVNERGCDCPRKKDMCTMGRKSRPCRDTLHRTLPDITRSSPQFLMFPPHELTREFPNGE